MGIFDKKREVSRLELREALRKGSPFVPGGGMLSREERVKLEKEVFSKFLGSYISKEEFKRTIRDLERKKLYAKSGKEKLELDRKIRYLRHLGGI